jgi:hypothetical protein
MTDTVESYLARGGQITELDSDYYGRSRGKTERRVVTARRPGRQHSGKWLVTGRGRNTTGSRVDTRISRGNRPFTTSRDTRPTAKHRQAQAARDGWSKSRPDGLIIG